MKYFVTGATGFVGGRVARQLRAAGHQVVALVRTLSKAGDLSTLGVQLVAGDVTDRESMRAPMRGVDGVFHIAGWYKIGTRDKRLAKAVNVDGTRNVLELMRELRIAKGVYTSTLAVNSDTHGVLVDETYRYQGPHLSEYDRTKAAAHHVAAKFAREGLPLVIVQPGLIYGPGDAGPSHELLVSYLTRKLPMVPQRTAFCWAHVDDVADGHVRAMEHGKVNENYYICGPPHTLIDALAVAEQLSGVRAPRLTAPPALLKTMSALMRAIEWLVPVPSNYSSEYLRVSAGVTYLGSNAKARAALAWVPRDLAVGLAETLPYEMSGLAGPTLG